MHLAPSPARLPSAAAASSATSCSPRLPRYRPCSSASTLSLPTPLPHRTLANTSKPSSSHPTTVPLHAPHHPAVSPLSTSVPLAPAAPASPPGLLFGLRACLALGLTALHLAMQPLSATAIEAVQDDPEYSSSTVAAAAETPYTLQSSIQYGVTPKGTIRACPGNINPNCVSTASTNDNYSPAWRASETDVEAAARVLERAVLGMMEDPEAAEQLKSETTAVGQYRMFSFQTSWGPAPDVVEFLIKPELGPGGKPDGALVTYRGMAGNIRYIWPVQQAVGDFGAQRQRLESIRGATGWQMIGCDVIECYQFSD